MAMMAIKSSIKVKPLGWRGSTFFWEKPMVL